LPFFLAAASGNVSAARAAVLELIGAYSPGTSIELDLAGRVIGFSIVAMDNLRLSMEDGLSATRVLRYRSNAVALSRASEQARLILQAIQANRESTAPIPRPAVAVAPTPAVGPTPAVAPTPAVTAAPDPQPQAPKAEPPRTAPANAINANPAPMGLDLSPKGLEAMKRDARIMMAAFLKQGAQASTAIGSIPDPTAFARSAPRFATARPA
jgi:hypothetical protein